MIFLILLLLSCMALLTIPRKKKPLKKSLDQKLNHSFYLSAYSGMTKLLLELFSLPRRV